MGIELSELKQLLDADDVPMAQRRELINDINTITLSYLNENNR